MYFTNEQVEELVAEIEGPIDELVYLKDMLLKLKAVLNEGEYQFFGFYWYNLKVLLQKYTEGSEWYYKKNFDQLIMEKFDHGSDLKNFVAAMSYAEENGYFPTDKHVYYEDSREDAKVYVLDDEDYWNS